MSESSDDDCGPGTQCPSDDEPSGVTVHCDWQTVAQPSVTVVETVAAVTGRRVTELPPLQETTDCSALDTVLPDGPPSLSVSFSYAGVHVTVDGGGTVTVANDEG